MSLLGEEYWAIKLPQLWSLERAHLEPETAACRQKSLYFRVVCANIGATVSLFESKYFT